ncbi:MAG: hypothetical protein ACI9RU_002562, partial [Litorivivens sp.]
MILTSLSVSFNPDTFSNRSKSDVKSKFEPESCAFQEP